MNKNSGERIAQFASWILTATWIGLILSGHLRPATFVLVLMLFIRAKEFLKPAPQHFSKGTTLFVIVWAVALVCLSAYLAYYGDLSVVGRGWGIRIVLLCLAVPLVGVVAPVEWRTFHAKEEQ